MWADWPVMYKALSVVGLFTVVALGGGAVLVGFLNKRHTQRGGDEDKE